MRKLTEIFAIHYHTQRGSMSEGVQVYETFAKAMSDIHEQFRINDHLAETMEVTDEFEELTEVDLKRMGSAVLAEGEQMQCITIEHIVGVDVGEWWDAEREDWIDA